ncbi:MAG: hypothetical protein QOH21_2330 [Acidobacteriota bacterium]|jgi:hypothetical protein|nr:hypothetical protein [Acidobacteriota bacterium]
MIACDRFRRTFQPGTDEAELLGHLRTCDPCLDFAANADPDVMFRALGGSEMIPPGGVDAFVDDVMQQVRVRTAESASAPRRVASWPRRLAVAATVTLAVTSATLVYRFDTTPAVAPVQTAHFQPAALHPPAARNLTTKPIVETYESDMATIVEVPSESAADDVKIVMIFDENLPADL